MTSLNGLTRIIDGSWARNLRLLSFILELGLLSDSLPRLFIPSIPHRNPQQMSTIKTFSPPLLELGQRSSFPIYRLTCHLSYLFEVFFKVRTTTPLTKVVDAYNAQQQAQPGTYRFYFDGVRIVPGDTPASLEMEDMDCIDVQIEQVGGHVIPRPYPQDEGEMFHDDGDEGEDFDYHEDAAVNDRAFYELTRGFAGLNFQPPAVQSQELVVEGNLAQPSINPGIHPPPRATMCISVKDGLGIQVLFRITAYTQLSIVFAVFCDMQSIDQRHIHFQIGGNLIFENDTALSLGMEDGDVIEVYRPVIVQEPEAQQDRAPSDDIYITVRCPEGDTVYFKIKENCQFEKLVKKWCEHKGEDPTQVRFLFDGARIHPDWTPGSLRMSSGDCIDVYDAQPYQGTRYTPREVVSRPWRNFRTNEEI